MSPPSLAVQVGAGGQKPVSYAATVIKYCSPWVALWPSLIREAPSDSSLVRYLLIDSPSATVYVHTQLLSTRCILTSNTPEYVKDKRQATRGTNIDRQKVAKL